VDRRRVLPTNPEIYTGEKNIPDRSKGRSQMKYCSQYSNLGDGCAVNDPTSETFSVSLQCRRSRQTKGFIVGNEDEEHKMKLSS
jgi:hypothetical protein